MLNLPICENCGRLLQDDELDGDVLCNDCIELWLDKMLESLGEGTRDLIKYNIRQRDKLGIGLDKRIDLWNFS